MVKLGNWIVVSFIILFSLSLQAKVMVKSRILTPNVAVGDQVQVLIKYTAEDSGASLGSKLKPPQSVSDGALEFIGTNQSSSSSFSFINGKSKSTYTKTLVLTYGAFKEGEWTIPQFDLGLGGQKAGPFKVRVYDRLPEKYRKEKSKKDPKAFGGLLDQVFGRDFDNPFNKTPNQKVEFFAEVEVDKTRVYKGEQIFVRFYLYASGVVTQFDTLKFPTFEGFWKEDVNFAGRFVWKPVMKNGKQMQRAELSSYILIPYKAGNHVVDSFELRASVVPHHFRFGRGTKVSKFKTKPVDIEVLPLGENRPESYQGGVGLFAAGVVGGRKRREVLEGQVFRVQLKVVGDHSNTKFVDAPKVDLGDDFKLLSQQEEYRFFPQNLSSMKIFTYNIIGKKLGVYKIPDVVMSFHKAFEKHRKEGLYYEVIQELPTLKVRDDPNRKKLDDEVYTTEADKNIWTLFSSMPIFDLLAFRTPSWFFWLVSMFGLIFVVLIFRKEINKRAKEDKLLEKLKGHSLSAEKDFKSGEFESSVIHLINYYYLIVGGITGKRLSTEEEFSSSLDSLPVGLKAKKIGMIETMQELQELRFGRKLSQKANQDKLKECIQRQTADAKTLESYIS